MQFRTEIPISKAPTEITYKDRVILMGSCFAENIGNCLVFNKFNVDVNPFGVLYNPYSIAKSVRRLITGEMFSASDLIFHNGLWSSFAHHGSFSDASQTVCLDKINQRLANSSVMLKNADYLIITFGTAWVYEQKETNEIVANCHKFPEKNFIRRRLSVNEIVNTFISLLSDVQEVSPKIKFVFTVSPIRHWKDGAHENQISKSTLLLAINELQERVASIQYFSAYEIVIDELRDYRFYNEDMIHPNNTAIQYIWEKFSQSYFSTQTLQLQSEIQQINKAEAHRPFNPETKEHKLFLERLKQQKHNLLSKHPYLKM
jgi:hypothetical protein